MTGGDLRVDANPIDEISASAYALLEAEIPAAVELRHLIHQNPRIGGDEQATSALIQSHLAATGVAVAEGFYVRVGPPAGPTVAIRAELDALPIEEASDAPWASTVAHVAHLCAHDVHLAALVATLRAISAVDSPVSLVGVFQPREEVIPSGANDFVHHEAFLGEGIDAMIGVHLQPAIADNALSSAPGAVNASADDFELRIHGSPGHGAYPQLSRDPIVAASAVVQALQTLVSRRTDPMNPTVLTIGSISGGDSPNQIAGLVTLSGTLRSFSEADRANLQDQLRSTAAGVALGYGCEAEVVIKRGEPVLHNDAGLTDVVTAALEREGFTQTTPFRSCGADDFAFYGQRFPSLMIFAGVGDGDAHAPGLHHPQFLPPDSSVRQVARIMLASYLAAARDLLSR